MHTFHDQKVEVYPNHSPVFSVKKLLVHHILNLSLFSYMANLIIESLQIAHRGGLNNRISLRTLEKLAIRNY